MSNPTSNYSWQMPTSSDLVTDLPADFEVFGQAVDTTTKALNPSTTLGDIEYRSSTANTNTRLAIGSSGQVLTVASGVPSWATASSGGYTSLASGSLSGSGLGLSSISGSYIDLVLIVRDYYFVNDDHYSAFVNGTTGLYTNMSIGTGDAPLTTSYMKPTQSENTNNADSNNFMMMRFYDYANTSARKICEVNVLQRNDANTNNRLITTIIGIDLAAAITSINLGTNTGGNVSGGTYVLYGVK